MRKYVILVALVANEEAGKMMRAEGPVETAAPVSDVKVNSSEKLQNFYQIARRAKDYDNSENAAKYYDLILQEDPMSWEASFYTVYYTAMQTNTANIKSAAIKVNNCIDTVFGLINDRVADEGEKTDAVAEVVGRVIIIANMLYNAATSHYNGISSDIKSKYTQEWLDRCCAARDLLYNTGDFLISNFGDESPVYTTLACGLWKNAITKHENLLPSFANQEINKQNIKKYADKVGSYDDRYRHGRT